MDVGLAVSRLCGCMDGPSDPDPSCLYCGGTGEWVSDERLAELENSYRHLAEDRFSIGRRDFRTSDRQHLAIISALQVARAAPAMSLTASAVGEPEKASALDWGDLLLGYHQICAEHGAAPSTSDLIAAIERAKGAKT